MFTTGIMYFDVHTLASVIIKIVIIISIIMGIMPTFNTVYGVITGSCVKPFIFMVIARFMIYWNICFTLIVCQQLFWKFKQSVHLKILQKKFKQEGASVTLLITYCCGMTLIFENLRIQLALRWVNSFAYEYANGSIIWTVCINDENLMSYRYNIPSSRSFQPRQQPPHYQEDDATPDDGGPSSLSAEGLRQLFSFLPMFDNSGTG